ncbi:MAG TPA: FG-GAP repeat protein, partial [Polyangia bacterium]
NGKSNVDLLSNDGTKLTWSEQIAIGKGVPFTIAATDLDGDGKPDLVVGLATGGLAVLMNQTPSR